MTRILVKMGIKYYELINFIVNIRSQLRNKKEYKLSDDIRSNLSKIEIQLEDKPDGTI